MGSHSFRLIHDRGSWNVHFAFFGGRVGAFVRFRGPNRETWRTANVVSPIGSSEWQVSTTGLLLPLPCRIEWQDLNRIVPSMPLAKVHSAMTNIS